MIIELVDNYRLCRDRGDYYGAIQIFKELVRRVGEKQARLLTGH